MSNFLSEGVSNDQRILLQVYLSLPLRRKRDLLSVDIFLFS